MLSRISFVLILSTVVSEVMASSMCARLSAHPDYLREERSYLLRMCEMSPLNATGPIIYIENGFLPLLDEFYLKVPQRNEISLASSRSPKIQSFDKKMEWPYNVIWIRRGGDSKIDSDGVKKQPILSEELSKASDMCGFQISLFYYKKKAPDLDFVGEFFELRIGETLIVFGGATEALAIITGEMFAQHNCK